MQYWIMQFVCVLLLFTAKCTFARPQTRETVYNYADKVIAGGSPIEDHSAHLGNVANAYRGTDQIYNDFPNVSQTLLFVCS